MPRPKPINPFYIVLLLVSVIFVVTVCGYTVLTFRGTSQQIASQPSEHGLLDFLDRHGMELMLAEVALIAVTTVGAITTDHYWAKRAYQRQQQLQDGASS